MENQKELMDKHQTLFSFSVVAYILMIISMLAAIFFGIFPLFIGVAWFLWGLLVVVFTILTLGIIWTSKYNGGFLTTIKENLLLPLNSFSEKIIPIAPYTIIAMLVFGLISIILNGIASKKGVIACKPMYISSIIITSIVVAIATTIHIIAHI